MEPRRQAPAIYKGCGTITGAKLVWHDQQFKKNSVFAKRIRRCLAFMAAIFFLFPSHKITEVRSFDAGVSVPKQIKAGETFVVEVPPDTTTPQLDDLALTPLLGRHGWWLGAVGFRDPQFMLLHGKRLSLSKSYTDRLKYFWQHPRLEYFEYLIEVMKPEDVDFNPLRLPAAVSEKVFGDNDLKITQAARLREVLKDDQGSFPITCWQAPLRSRETSPFGSPRELDDGQRYFHGGQDLRAPTGTAIKAIGPGKTVLAEEFIIPGRIVVIDHGGGVFSRYMHLNEFLTAPNEKVTAGQLIGFSGATGRVEAPHLHWEVIWKGKAVDPTSFLLRVGQLCGST